jgi:outer membrane protein assembly factor BamD (BamD/ComL family)
MSSRIISLLALAALLAVPAAAQSIDQRYETARDHFNNGRMEDACELFQQIDREKPGYKETGKFLNMSCAQAKLLYDLEEKLYNEGVQLMNQGKLEDARGKFTQAAGIPLKAPKRRSEINRALREIESRESEGKAAAEQEKVFAEGVRLYEQGQLEQARQRFEGVSGPKAAEARTYIQRIDQQLQAQGAAQREDAAFNAAVDLFNRGDLPGARRGFDDVARMNGKRKSEAENYLARIDQTLNARREEDTVFQDGVRKFDRKDYEGARSSFQRVAAMNGSRKADAQSYLTRIDQELRAAEAARRQAQQATAGGETPQQAVQRLLGEAREAMNRRDYKTAQEKLQVAEVLDPRNSELQRLLAQARDLQAEQSLRAGLQAYFEGRWDDAERSLSQYLEGNGRKRGLALFFRGATRSTRFFLSGEKDAQQKELAQADFRAVGEASRNFRVPERHVSPKILDLYKASSQ